MDETNTRVVNITLNSSASSSYTVTTAQVVTGPQKNSYNDFNTTETVNIQTLAASSYTLTGKTLKVTLPSKSIAMLVLTPAGVSTTLPGAFDKNGANTFSITSGSNGTVLITSSISRKTPVTISLFSVDGRTLIGRTVKTFQAGNSSLIFGNNGRGSGVCIVKIVGEGIAVSKRVVVAR